MSDPQNISPLLDGFAIGAPISEHHGVVCCPAIKENTNKKCILKIITIPASQAQFDALMLAGAYKDPGDAMEYFRGNGEDILKEAELLKSLSRIEGFLPYDGWQMEPITRRRLGYEVYLVGSYKRSLDKYMQKHAFTHLEAVNLGLDLCAALSVCRQSGYMYSDLKPSNIYVSDKKEFRIGDLGFLALDSMRYASLPERYYSPYTPPELLDPMASMNLTVDTYAVGMILYQLYNDGQLAFSGISPTAALPNPVHADYEMAEIIMKAIHPDPEQRWTDPKELGKAIASYMQRNSINDIPITPFIPLDVKPEDIVVLSSKKKPESDTEENIEITETDTVSTEEPVPVPQEEAKEELVSEETEPAPEEEAVVPENIDDNQQIPEALPEEEPEVIEANISEEMPEETSDSSEAADLADIKASEEEPEFALSEEVSKIISRADDLIAHEIPEETGFPEAPEESDPFSFVKSDLEDTEDSIPLDPLMEEAIPENIPSKKKKAKSFEDQTRKKKWKKFFSGCFTILLLCALFTFGFWYYLNVYLQPIDGLRITGTQDEVTVLVDTAIEESLLTVHCTDANGKSKTASIQGGKAVFTGLKPSTEYTILVDMKGFHKLTGNYSDTITTEATTQILSIHAIAGSEDGSVMLNFTVDGDDPDFWYIHYTADGEEELVETVTGHSAMISGLTVGKVYTFTLGGGKNFDLSGETSIQYLASKLILAEDLTATSSNGSDITIQWNTPGDVVVENWNVRCYDGYGFEEQVTVTENSVLFTGLDASSSYTVEITAAGMTQPSKINISADPINVSAFTFDEGAETEMQITWEYTGNKPEGGWLLMYTVDGSGSQTITCEKASATISPLIPGAKYQFVLQSADNRTVFNNMTEYQAEAAAVFTANAFVAENVSIDLLKTPEDAKWTCETVGEDVFTNTFAPGESASIAMRSSSALYYPGNKTSVLFVFRDAYGNVLPEFTNEVTYVWKNIWTAGNAKNGELNIPCLPTASGEYVLELYFDGCSVAQFDLTITE